MAELSQPIIVIGGGWAGLSCAIELTRLGHQVTLLESARQLGGRARCVRFHDLPVDNGQHILLGAYRQTLQLLRILNLSESTVLRRIPLHLHLEDAQHHTYSLNAPNIPAPLHLLTGLLNAKGFTTHDRWRAIAFGIQIWRDRLSKFSDRSVLNWLQEQKQSSRLIDCLWQPLCLAAMNTPIHLASAQVFQTILRDAFCQTRQDSEILLPRTDLGALLPNPALDYIEQHDGTVLFGQRVEAIHVHQRQIVGVQTQQETIDSTQVVLAVPPHAALSLLETHPALHDLVYQLRGFTYEPICTVYIQYPSEIRSDLPIQGFVGMTTQWLIDRQVTGHPGLMAVVISGPGPHMQWDSKQLADQVITELADAYPHWPKPSDHYVIREKRATFSCRVGIQAIRPDNATPVNGLWLAGDYTNTHYPATIEGAVRSGLRCAQLLHQQNTTSA